MKKRSGVEIAGGVIEIIAGISWLGWVLPALGIYSLVENGLNNFDWVQIICPIAFIFFGIMACVGKMKKDLIVYGLLNLLFIGWLIYKGVKAGAVAYFISFVSGEIILLLIASFLFFSVKKNEDNTTNNKTTDDTNDE